MKISYSWLKNYIQLDLPVEKLSEILTDIGLEVGGVEQVQSVKGGMEGLVIGEVMTCAPHPNADKLSVTTVNIGSEEPLPIVCGAPNVAAGQKVVVATVGTVLYQGDESFSIKKSKIRGEVSQGMICAEDEIGLGTNHDGIMVLPAEVEVGILAKDYFKIETDAVYEIDLTPNRIDSASHFGTARDLAAYLKQSNETIQAALPSVDAFQVENRDYPVEVVVENTNACPRYSGVTISGIEVKESPEWLKNRLTSIGMVPINNVVDVTNFVLHEVGQPLHAFDGDKVLGDKVVVKNLADGTLFTTLDEKERELSENDLMICNEQGGMCIAGVFGGIESGVTEKTTKIFLESACFNPVSIRKTAKRHILNTDASFRFERGTDPNITIYALKRAALLIKEVAGGTISSDVVDIYPQPVADFEVEVAYKNVDRLIGKELGKERIKLILQALDINIKSESEDGLTLLVPPYRVDVQREADVIEEVLRIYGYNNVEMPDTVHSTIVYSQKPDEHKLRNTVAGQLVARGFQEIMCNSLTKASYYDELKTYERDQVVELANPLSSDLNGMRQTLLLGGLETIQHNRNRRNSDLKLFEFGNCYYKKPHANVNEHKSYREAQHLAVFMTGMKEALSWNTPAQEVSFFDLKNQVESILSQLGVTSDQWSEDASSLDLLSEGLSYVCNNKEIVNFGLVHTRFLKEFDVDVPVYYAEFYWEQLLKASAQNEILYREIPKFPEVKRDLALLIDKAVTFAQIKAIALKTERKLLKRLSLFDVYEGDKMEKGKKSYAVSFILQDETKTLKDKQIDKIMQKFMMVFEKEIGAQIRK
jgi:phenylalanyl-tRNA synthetase beta chain